MHPSRAQHVGLPLPVFPVAGPSAPGASVAPAQHGMSVSYTVWKRPWSALFVFLDGEVWILGSHGMQLWLSHRIPALGGIAQALGAVVGQQEQSRVRFSETQESCAHGWSGSWAS